MLAASALFFVAQPKVAHATANVTLPNPYWWVDNTGAFSQCDQYYYNHGHDHQGVHYSGSGQNDAAVLSILATYQGVWACGPRPGTGTGYYVYFTPDANASQEAEWQCTELVKRYLFLKYGVSSLGNTNGSQVVDNYYNAYPNLFSKVLNNGNFHVQAGDVLSYSSPDNHTAIVQDTSNVDANGNGYIIVLEQNASANGVHNQTVSNWVIKHGVDDALESDGHGGYLDTVLAWLHGPPDQAWSNNSPSGISSSATINALSSTSTSNVWAAGYEVSGGVNVPLTYYNSGSGWTKYSPTSHSYSSNNQLSGIATSSSSNAWAVGSYYSTYYNNTLTLAYKWNSGSSTWGSPVTTANPAGVTSLNQFNAVALDSSGTPWAVGYYWINGNQPQPILEKWNGSAFVTQTLGSGVAGAWLYGISFSSTNGWAVGQAAGSSSSYVIYKYNGSSWSSPTIGSNSNEYLTSVTAVSDSEAWAVGEQPNGSGHYKPLILHTTDGGSTWTEDTSFASYPAGALVYVNSVSGDNPNDVWIVGYYRTGTNYQNWYTLAMHNFGYGWTFTTPSMGINAVTVSSGDAWSGGGTNISVYS